jgi:hypothetical protein
VYTGWTIEHIETTLTLPRLRALEAVWEDVPPLALTVARFAGVRPKRVSRKGPAASETPDLGNLVGELERAQGRSGVTALPPPSSPAPVP